MSPTGSFLFISLGSVSSCISSLPACCLLSFLSLPSTMSSQPLLLPCPSLPLFNTCSFLLAVSVFHHCAVLPLPPLSLSLRDGLRSTGSRVFVSCYSMWARNSTIPPFQIACFLAQKEHVCTHTACLLQNGAHTHTYSHMHIIHLHAHALMCTHTHTTE